jgi:putative transposase
VRNTLKYVADKDRKPPFAKDLKTIYNAPSEKEGLKALDDVTAA